MARKGRNSSPPPPAPKKPRTSRANPLKEAPKKASVPKKAATSKKAAGKRPLVHEIPASAKGKGKKPAIPQEEEEEPMLAYGEGSYLQFLFQEQLDKFITTFEQATIMPPRFIRSTTLANYGYHTVHKALTDGNWYNFVSKRVGHYYPALIRAFYSGIERPENDSAYTIVNGMRIFLNEQTMAQVTGLPVFDPSKAPPHLEYNEAQFLQRVMKPGFPLPYNSSGRPTVTRQWRLEYRILLYLITYIIAPRKTSHTTVTQQDAMMMYVILNNIPWNWNEYILDNLLKKRNDPSNLAYVPIIMDYLEESGAISANCPAKSALKNWEVTKATFRIKKGDDEDEADDDNNNDGDDRAQRPAKTLEAGATSSGKASKPTKKKYSNEELGSMLETIMGTLKKYGKRIKKINRRIKNVCTHLNIEEVADPSSPSMPPPSPPQAPPPNPDTPLPSSVPILMDIGQASAQESGQNENSSSGDGWMFAPHTAEEEEEEEEEEDEESNAESDDEH